MNRNLFFLTIASILIFICACVSYDSQLNDISVDLKNEDNIVDNTFREKKEKTDVNNKQNLGPISLDVKEAILVALKNNQSLAVQKLMPLMQKLNVEKSIAEFEPNITANISRNADRRGDSLNKTTNGSINLSKKLPAGTRINLGVNLQHLEGRKENKDYSAQTTLSLTQPLLKGLGIKVNLASVRQAKINVQISEYELRGFVENLVAEVEETYWNLYLFQKQISIYEQSLELAKEQLEEIKERVKVGKLPEVDIAAAKAELASRKQALIEARNQFNKMKLHMLYLLNLSSNLESKEIILKQEPVITEVNVDNIQEHINTALKMRPDLNEARLRIKNGKLEIIKTKNGLLPKLDLFITIGETGYANSFIKSFGNINNTNYGVEGGLTLSFSPLNKANKADYKYSVLSLQEAYESIKNMEKLAQVDVQTAILEVKEAREQIEASKANRELQAEKLRVETEKFRVGKSTNLLVFQAQRDFISSEISEIQSLIGYLKAITKLRRVEGSLLEYYGISVSEK